MMAGRYDQPEAPESAPRLFDDALVPIEPYPTLVAVDPAGTNRPAETIQEAFDRFHAANPWVYAELERMALELVRAGHRRIGIGMLFEVLRWRWLRATTDTGSTFHLNNNYRSRYARLLMAHPELDDVFETRVVRTA